MCILETEISMILKHCFPFNSVMLSNEKKKKFPKVGLTFKLWYSKQDMIKY